MILHIYIRGRGLQGDDGSSQQKLDFRLVLPCRDMMVAIPCSTDTFTQLLTSGELTAKSSRKVSSMDTLHTVLGKICFYAHMYGRYSLGIHSITTSPNHYVQ